MVAWPCCFEPVVAQNIMTVYMVEEKAQIMVARKQREKNRTHRVPISPSRTCPQWLNSVLPGSAS
jgi:hypothetical protein